MKKILFTFTLIILLAVGCDSKPSPSKQAQNQTTETQSNKDSIRNLPDDIFPGQIGSFYDSYLYPSTYMVNGNVYALVLEPSVNYNLPALKGKEIMWHGVLRSQDNGKTWVKFFSIVDPSDLKNKGQKIKYNPAAVFLEEDKIYVDIVNTLGAGSGEGQLIRFATNDEGKTWQRNECYYFVPEQYYNNAEAGQIKINVHSLKKMDNCTY